MKNTNKEFLFAIHFHQPFGNFDNIIETTFRRSYRPLLDCISQFPNVKTTIHFSGPLLLWLEKNHPEYIDKIKHLIEKKQIELLGGTYSEALLAVLDENIRLIQLKKYKELIKRIFGENIKLKGFWLTERIWVPEIIPCLTQNDYEYVFLDEDIIKKGGKNNSQKIFLHKYKDSSIKIIPINKFLRYNFPFRDIESIIEHIKENKFSIHADDGEKFGDWPGMYEFLYEKEQYINDFFKQCEENKICFINAEKLIENNNETKKIYIPYSSYDGMNKWSMFPDNIKELYKKFTKETIEEYSYIFHTGNFFNFFIKYPESNSIYKKNKYFCRIFKHNSEVFEQLLKSQCCCAYWHGIFGGIYLPHLRDAINLGNIFAEKQMPDGISEIEDILLLKNNKFALTFEKKAGSLSSITLLHKFINIINAFSRKPEFYHKDYENEIFYDNSLRNSFIDRIISEELDCDKYIKRMYGDQSDIFLKDYNLITNCETPDIIRAECNAKCFIDDKVSDLFISKSFKLENNVIKVKYNWKTQIISSEKNFLSIELNFHNIFGNKKQTINTNKIELNSDLGIKIKLHCDNAQKIILTPVYTVSNNHQEIENIQQCYAVIIQIPLSKQQTKIIIEI
ncbi:MAG: DUF1926 domain-containing protein [Candidatus Muirbacterium halophilum]|nr:DUF1926 domain-containing protein [Candidatus Muirbacterium halophilum]MCK9475477.1 DUF1926 domain-containing protein [Candidatus Muirbacterium halophilum]